MDSPELAVTRASPAQRAARREALLLEIALAEAWPWPGLIVRAALRLGSALIRLRKLNCHGDGFRCHGVLLEAPPADASIVRALQSLPTVDGVAYRADGALFAPVLALLRGASPNVVRRESDRVAACLLLRRPPQRVIKLGPALPDGRVKVAPSYRDPETQADLGWPVRRDGEWWTFGFAVGPAPAALEGRLHALFEAGPSEATQAEAASLLAADIPGLVVKPAGETVSAARPFGPISTWSTTRILRLLSE